MLLNFYAPKGKELRVRDSKNLYKIDEIRVTLSPRGRNEKVLCVSGLIRSRS